MKELRCKKCGKLLAKGSGEVEIKCSRCKKVNRFPNKERLERHS